MWAPYRLSPRRWDPREIGIEEKGTTENVRMPRGEMLMGKGAAGGLGKLGRRGALEDGKKKAKREETPPAGREISFAARGPFPEPAPPGALLTREERSPTWASAMWAPVRRAPVRRLVVPPGRWGETEGVKKNEDENQLRSFCFFSLLAWSFPDSRRIYASGTEWDWAAGC